MRLKIFYTIKNYVISLVIAIIAISIMFVTFNVDNEEKVAYDNELYGEQYQLLESENIGYAIIGITAPGDVHDFHDYGMKLVKNALNEHVTTNNIGIPRFMPDENEIDIVGVSEKLLCWWEIEEYKLDNCMSTNDIKTFTNNNKLLLSRYFQLHNYRKIDLDVLLSRNDNIIIPLHNIFLAYLSELMVNEEYDKLYAYLFDDIKLWENLAGNRVSWIQKVIIIRALTDDLEFVTALEKHGSFDFNKAENVKDLFTPITPSNWALSDTYVMEYRLIELKLCLDNGYDYITGKTCLNRESDLFYKRNTTLTKILDYINDLIKIANSSQDVQLEYCSKSYSDIVKISNLPERYVFNYYGNEAYVNYVEYNSLHRLCKFLSAIDKIDSNLKRIQTKLSKDVN